MTFRRSMQAIIVTKTVVDFEIGRIPFPPEAIGPKQEEQQQQQQQGGRHANDKKNHPVTNKQQTLYVRGFVEVFVAFLFTMSYVTSL